MELGRGLAGAGKRLFPTAEGARPDRKGGLLKTHWDVICVA